MQQRIIQPSLVFLIFFLAMAPFVHAQSDLTPEGIAFLKAQRFDEAEKLFSRMIKADPRNAKAFYYRGMARYYKGKLDAAIADYTRTLELDPDLANVHTSRGAAYFRKGDYQKANKDLAMALKKNPGDANAINQKAWMLAVCPDPNYRDGKKALALARKAINAKTTPNYLDTLAAAYAENGQYKRAAEIQRKVIALLTQEERLNRIETYLARLKKYEAGLPWREDGTKIESPAPKIAPTVQTKIEKKEDKKTTAPPSPAPALKKTAATTAPVAAGKKQVEKNPLPTAQPQKPLSSGDSGRYPYTIFISTYQDPGVTKAKVLRLRKNGDPVFVSHAYFKKTGHWYQIYFGWYKNPADAAAAAEKLKQRKFKKTIVVKKPYAVQVGTFGSEAMLKKMETSLLALNYPAYRIGDPDNPGKTRLLIGAYSTQIVPDQLLKTLTAAGFEPKVVLR